MFLLRIIILALLFVASIASASSDINLTAKELEYIKENPIVTIGIGQSFAPRIYRNSDGSITGIDRDVADLIEEKTGLRIQFELGEWNKVQQRALNGELDGLSSMTKTQDREPLYLFTHPYLSYTGVAIVNRANPQQIYRKEDVKNKRAAVQRGSRGLEKLTRSLDGVEIVYYDDMSSLLNAVVNNEVDFTVMGQAVYFLAEQLGISEFISTSFVVGAENYSRFALRKDKQELQSIFNKALDAISPYQLQEIKHRWFKTANSQTINLTIQEQEYLNQKKQINVCIDPNWYPYEENEKGKHVGMSADFFADFEKKIHTPFKFIPTENWSESLQAVKKGKCEVLALAMKTEQRETYLNFTSPYLEIPVVIATKKQVPFVQGFEGLKGKKVSAVKGGALVDVIKKAYPYINIIETKDIDDGLKRVVNGEVFGYLDALATISHRMQINQIDNLKISGSFDLRWALGVAVRKDDLMLLGIFEKLVASVDNKQRQDILNKYISVTYEGYIDYTMIYKVMAVFLIVILLVLVWNNRIRKEKIVLDKLYAELQLKEKKLEEAYDELEQISTTDKLTNIYNRRKIDMAFADELERCKRTHSHFSLILFDIDYFKSVNDTYGHQVGDQFLSEFAYLVQTYIRKLDIFGRWGGEEFLIISPDSSDESPYVRAERVRKLIEEHDFSVVGNRTASFGVTAYKQGDSMDSMLQRVDDAMYQAKKAGRNRVVVIE